MDSFLKVRTELGWTPYKMAKELGISQTQYTYLEKIGRSPGLKTSTLFTDIAVEKGGYTHKEVHEMLKKDAWTEAENEAPEKKPRTRKRK